MLVIVVQSYIAVDMASFCLILFRHVNILTADKLRFDDLPCV